MEEIKRKTKRDILVETIHYYRKNPFGYDEESGVCVYYGPNGEMCAVGRCMMNPESFKGITATATEILKKDDELLKPEYRGHEILFWEFLQRTHDMQSSEKKSEGIFYARNYGFHKLLEMIKEDEKRS